MADKVEIKLAHPWTDTSNPDKPKAYNTGDSVSVTAEVAERLVTGGIATRTAKPAAQRSS